MGRPKRIRRDTRLEPAGLAIEVARGPH